MENTENNLFNEGEENKQMSYLACIIGRFKSEIQTNAGIVTGDFKEILKAASSRKKFIDKAQEIPIIKYLTITEYAFRSKSQQEEHYDYLSEKGIEVEKIAEKSVYLTCNGKLILLDPNKKTELLEDSPAKQAAFAEHGWTKYKTQYLVGEISPETCITRSMNIVNRLEEILLKN